MYFSVAPLGVGAENNNNLCYGGGTTQCVGRAHTDKIPWEKNNLSAGRGAADRPETAGARLGHAHLPHREQPLIASKYDPIGQQITTIRQ